MVGWLTSSAVVVVALLSVGSGACVVSAASADLGATASMARETRDIGAVVEGVEWLAVGWTGLAASGSGPAEGAGPASSPDAGAAAISGTAARVAGASGPDAEAAFVAAYRPAQVASNTATPRIQLPTTPATATAGARATGTAAAAATMDAAATITTAAGAGGAGAGAGAGTETAGVPGVPGGTPGGQPPGGAGGTVGLPGTPTVPIQPLPAETPAIAAPALPGESGAAGSGAASGSGAAGGSSGIGQAGTGIATDLGGAGEPGPSGLIRVPVEDPVIRRMWSRFGSPRVDEPPLMRLTAGRPGPWGSWAWYVVLVGAIVWVLAVVVRDLTAAAEATRREGPPGPGDLAAAAGATNRGGSPGPVDLAAAAEATNREGARGPRHQPDRPRQGPPTLALVLLSLALPGLVASACARTPTAPTDLPVAPAAVAAPATPDPSASTDLPVGVQVFEAEVETNALEQLRAAGVSWARTRALWKLIEPERRDPPAYDWSVTDWLFGDVTAAGFRQVASVYANPAWAATTECGPVAPEHLERYAALWQALVERYDGDGTDDAPTGGVVRYWQVGNEADFDATIASEESDYGSCFGNDPAAYAEQVVVAYRAAKAADPSVEVGFGPVAYDRFASPSAPPGWSSPPGPFAYDFTIRALEHLYTAHAGEPDLPFFDFVSLHNYNDNAHFWDGAEAPLQSELVGKVRRFRDEQLAVPGVFDVRGMPLMISETGLADSPSDEYTARSEALQAAHVAQTMVRAQAAGVIAAIWYTARDNIFGDCAPPHWDWLTFGLMRSSEYRDALDSRCPVHPWIETYDLPDGPATPKAAMTALATLTDALRGFTFDRQLDARETGDPAIEAYRFVSVDARSLIAAWTTTGERLGKLGVEPLTATLTVSAALLSPWTGAVIATDHLGTYRALGEVGAGHVQVQLDSAPAFIAPRP